MVPAEEGDREMTAGKQIELFNLYDGQYGRSGGPYLDQVDGSVVYVSREELEKVSPNVSAPADFQSDVPNVPVDPVLLVKEPVAKAAKKSDK